MQENKSGCFLTQRRYTISVQQFIIIVVINQSIFILQ